MQQRHMKEAVFSAILDGMGDGSHVVSMQGEGEPTTHPEFWPWARKIRALGHTPYTITNGSLIDAEEAEQVFDEIGVSLDTVDRDDAAMIGRKVGPVVANIENLVRVMGARRVIVHTVDCGQDTSAMDSLLRQLGVRRVVQKLQTKADYAIRYGVPKMVEGGRVTSPCRFLERQIVRYFNVDGHEYPCCFIKQAGGASREVMLAQMEQGLTPTQCAGCRELPLG